MTGGKLAICALVTSPSVTVEKEKVVTTMRKQHDIETGVEEKIKEWERKPKGANAGCLIE
jgi:hypothetical protein